MTATAHARHQTLTEDQLADLELRFAGLLGTPSSGCSHCVEFSFWATTTAPSSDRDAELVLCDREGAPVGRMIVRSTHDHEGSVRLVTGAVSPLGPFEGGVARSRRASGPLDAAETSVVAAFSAPPDGSQVARLAEAAGGGSARVVAVVDVGTPVRRVLRLLDALDAACLVTEAPPAELLVLPRAGGPDAHTDVRASVLARYAGSADVLDFGRGGGSEPATGGVVILLTGLSGSGKSTIARELAEHLLRSSTCEVTLLDGDEVRVHLSSGLGFSREDRATNLRRIAWVAALVARHGGVAICAPIAPYAAIRAEMRDMIEPHGRLILVYVSTPLHVCEERDRKGLYARARAGLISGFTGIDDPYEVPTDADLVVDTSAMPLEDAVRRIAGRVWSGPSAGGVSP